MENFQEVIDLCKSGIKEVDYDEENEEEEERYHSVKGFEDVSKLLSHFIDEQIAHMYREEDDQSSVGSSENDRRAKAIVLGQALMDSWKSFYHHFIPCEQDDVSPEPKAKKQKIEEIED